MNKRKIGASLLIGIWIMLVLMVWFLPNKQVSVAERRPLAKRPNMSFEDLWDRSYMENFEKYGLDQFPLRDSFRKVKSLFHYYGLGQKDNNNIYIYKGHGAKMEYPLNYSSVDFALRKFQYIYDNYLEGKKNNIIMAMVPDKSYYMAEASNHLSVDYVKLNEYVNEKIRWATHVDLSNQLTLDDYYRTDTHWKQENLFKPANKLAEALKVSSPDRNDYQKEKITRPFYGVFYGQAALPMKADNITLMESDFLKKCSVFDYEKNEYTEIYNREKIDGKDMYEVYLSGAKALLEIENPSGKKNRELIIFRDSFASSIAPLLMEDYSKIIMVDIRYISSKMIGEFIDFKNQDVLFLYNSLIFNNSSVLK